MRGSTAFKNACLTANPKFRVRFFINFDGSHDDTAGSGKQWEDDWQSPNTTHWPNLADFIKDQFHLNAQENDSITSKTTTRKLNLTLDNKNRAFDYRIFGTYNPTAFQFNGAYDSYVFSQSGKKVGNIRSGRLCVFQIGVYSTVSPVGWIYIDKFRGRTADWQISQNDQSVQLTVEDERTFYQQKDAGSYVYYQKNFKYIFEDQAALLGLPSGKINCFTIPTGKDFVYPFFYVPDAGNKIIDVLEKLAETVAATVSIDEVGALTCKSRMYQGDGTAATGDAYRTFGTDDCTALQDTLSTTRVFNQQIINKVTVTASPQRIDDQETKCWKFNLFYNDQASRNEGYLLPGHFFGDVWAYNIIGQDTASKGPVLAISRTSSFDAVNIVDRVYTFELTSAPYESGGDWVVAVKVSRAAVMLAGGTTLPALSKTGTMICGEAYDDFADLSSVFSESEFTGVWIRLAAHGSLQSGDQAELQLGMMYFAQFGDFKVFPNSPSISDPLTESNVKFTIISAERGSGGAWGADMTAGTTVNNTPLNDRVCMALDPSNPSATNWNTQNVFFRGSGVVTDEANRYYNPAAWDQIPILLQNRSSNTMYVKSLEIFGRRMIVDKNTKTTVQAPDAIIQAFGGEQAFEIQNDLFPTLLQASTVAHFVVANNCVPRDIPKLVIDRPRPYLQISDRILVVDAYAGLNKEYVIKILDEVYSIDKVEQTFDLREADASIFELEFKDWSMTDENPLTTLGNSADVGNGQVDALEQPTNDFSFRFSQEPALQGALTVYITCTSQLKTDLVATDVVAKYVNADVITVATPLAKITGSQNSYVITYTIDSDYANHGGLATFTVGADGGVATINNKVAQGKTTIVVQNTVAAFVGRTSLSYIGPFTDMPISVGHSLGVVPYKVNASIRFRHDADGSYSNWFEFGFSTSHDTVEEVAVVNQYNNSFYVEKSDANIIFHGDFSHNYTDDWGDHVRFGPSGFFSAANKAYFWVKNSAGVLVNTWDQVEICYNIEN